MQFLISAILLQLAVSLSISYGLSSELLVDRQTTAKQECAPLHVLAVRGLDTDGSTDWYSYLIYPINAIKQLMPTATTVGIPYQAGDTNQLAGLNNGTLQVIDYVEQYVSSCPKSKVAILGYSNGATVVSNAICGSTAPYYPNEPLAETYAQNNVVATVVWGDLTHAAEQRWNQGNCPEIDFGITPRVLNNLCDPYAAGYLNYCDEGDFFCCHSLNVTNNAHHTYQDYYTQSTAEWVVNRYKESL